MSTSPASPPRTSHQGSQGSLDAVLKRIKEDHAFVLATHENPDGDALGSLVAMQGLLTALGKDSLMFIGPRDFPLPREYTFFELDSLIQSPPDDIRARTVVFLDCGNIDRNPAADLRDGAHLLNIDHHHDNTRFGSINHVVPGASCTAEIVWTIMNTLGVPATLPVAEALYVGLVTDTGRFMYENTGPRAHEMAADLIAAGVDVQTVYRRLYEEVPYAKLNLLALALGRLRRFDSGRLIFSTLTLEDFRAAETEESFSEGIVDYLRAVAGTKVAALVREKPGALDPRERKVSLRSSADDIDVSVIARAQGGGGHRRAAGFSTALGIEELISFLRLEIEAQLEHAPGSRPAPTLA